MNEKKGDIPRWKDRFDEVKTLKTYDPNFKWMHLVIGKSKEDGHFILRLRKFGNNFNINSKKHLAYVKKMLEEGSKELDWHEELGDKEIKELIKKNKEFKELKQKSKKQIIHQKEVVENLLSQVGKLREEKFKIGLDEFKKDLKKFKSLLKNNFKEKELQNWLYEHPWVFGPTYIDNSKEEINRQGDWIDFIMQRYDTFYDIFELKLPSCKLFSGKRNNKIPQNDVSRKYPMSSEVKDAISQVIEYLEEYELDKTNIAWKKGISIHKPKATIVIGRNNKDEKRAMKTLNSYLNNIEIITYDDIVEKANNFIKLIENRNREK